jgi:hypothetical protein
VVLRSLTWLVPVAVIGLLYSQGVLGAGPTHTDALRVVVGGIIAILAVWFFLNFAESLWREGSPTIESHWGGLGGGVGGWRISASLVYLVGLIGFGLLLVLAMPAPETKPESPTPGAPAGPSGANPEAPAISKPSAPAAGASGPGGTKADSPKTGGATGPNPAAAPPK